MNPTYTITLTLSRSDSDVEMHAAFEGLTRDRLLDVAFPVPGMTKLLPLLDEGIKQQASLDFESIAVVPIEGKTEPNVN